MAASSSSSGGSSRKSSGSSRRSSSGSRSTSASRKSSSSRSSAAASRSAAAAAQSPGDGWVAFIGVLFLVLGAFNIMDGVLAVIEDDRFVADELFFSDLTTWGIIHLAIGGLQLLTALLVFGRSAAGVWLGVFLASINLIAQLFFIGVYPFWSVAIIVVDLLVIYGLTVYGYEPKGKTS